MAWLSNDRDMAAGRSLFWTVVADDMLEASPLHLNARYSAQSSQQHVAAWRAHALAHAHKAGGGGGGARTARAARARKLMWRRDVASL